MCCPSWSRLISHRLICPLWHCSFHICLCHSAFIHLWDSMKKRTSVGCQITTATIFQFGIVPAVVFFFLISFRVAADAVLLWTRSKIRPNAWPEKYVMQKWYGRPWFHRCVHWPFVWLSHFILFRLAFALTLTALPVIPPSVSIYCCMPTFGTTYNPRGRDLPYPLLRLFFFSQTREWEEKKDVKR